MNNANEPAGITGGTAAPNAASPASRSDEVEATAWIFRRVAEGRPLPVAEAECVVNAMYGEHKWGGRLFFPLLRVDEPTEFMAVHGVNVATVAMALAGSQQFDPASVRRVGVAALLHDIGMAKVPVGTWSKAGKLTPEERTHVMAHPNDGATLLLAAHASLDLAAVVAYEHHLRMDGSGYPKLTYPRSAHFVSRLVQVCDVFCALSTDRPYRKAWPLEVILSFLDERSGFEFHPTIATALTGLVRDDLTVAAL
jgi:HD-GYP domain-containing protein (c-di-GMP phosphodiesterase class II)